VHRRDDARFLRSNGALADLTDRPARFLSSARGYHARMAVLTKRNAVVGWIVLRVKRKRIERKLNRIVQAPRRRGKLLAGVGITAIGATTIALVARRDRSEPSHASA
jgi:hypothetical protein